MKYHSEEEELFYTNNPHLCLQKEIINGEESFYRPGETWIQTYTGRRFNPTNPVVEAICIEDIAHALSMQCRFSGHVKEFYSVANHCILASYLCDTKDKLHGLLHDASEAYLVDIPSPIKRSGQFNNYLEFEKRMEAALAKKFGIAESMPTSVKLVDELLLVTEARDLMSTKTHKWSNNAKPLPFIIKPLSQQDSKKLFIERFNELKNI